MDHTTYYLSRSPEAKAEHVPETDFYTSPGWTDGLFVSGAAPFSPVMSDSNQSAYTLPASDVSFPSLGSSYSQEFSGLDVYQPDNWIADQPTYNFFAESAGTDTEMFAFPAQAIDVLQPTFGTWYTPTQTSARTHFAMDSAGQTFANMVPQTAGFVGNPTDVPPSFGYSDPNLRAGHVRVDSLYAQTCSRDAAVSHNHVTAGTQTQEINGHRRMTVPATLNEPIHTVPLPNAEQDVPYGAPVQQYRTHMPGYPNGSMMPFSGQPNIPVLGSNASVSSAGSVVPSCFEEIPGSPASSVATTRTRAEDTDGRARTDPLYSARPGKDGSYRCPFLASDGCQHKATKLKCNYECVSFLVFTSNF